MKKISSLLFIAALFCSTLVVTNGTANALSGASWKPGRIIDDSLFFDKNQMNVNDIQAFLNWQVPSCDTWGTKLTSGGQTRAQYGSSQGVPPPYICLRDYYENPVTHETNFNPSATIPSGAKSAAQIIYDSAQQYNINPKILLVTLKKEAAENLIGDDWPWPTQYRSAMGYGCPDTAPCDAEYYGFYNQMYNAARQFRSYANYPSEYRYKAQNTNYVLYNPNASCGGTNVYIESQATAGLYNYTPYQPNAAALNNLYGSGDSCSAYGNRNFWRIYNDWFGSTSAPLVRTPDSPTLYYSDGSSRYRVGSMSMVAEYGLGVGDVRIIPQSEMDVLPLAGAPSTPDLKLMVKSNSDSDQDGGTLYLISQGKRYPVVSMEQFADFGYQVSDIGYLPYSELSRMPLASNLNNFVQSSNGFVYKVSAGKKQGIFDNSTLLRLNNGGPVTPANDFVLSNLQVGQAILEGNLVMRGPDGKLWLVDGGKWRYVPSIAVYDCLNLKSLTMIEFNYSQTIEGTPDSDASCLMQTSGGTKYLANGGQKLVNQPSFNISTGFNTLSDEFINRFSTITPSSQNAYRMSSGELYIISGGKKHYIVSMESFRANGLSENSILYSDGLLKTIETGSYKLDTGMVVRDEQHRLYVITDNTRLYITSMEVFYGYGFAVNSIISLPASAFSEYSENGNLQSLARTPGANLFDKNTAWTISQDLHTHYGVGQSTPTYPASITGRVGYVKPATRFIKSTSSAMVYYLENAVKRPVYNWSTVLSLGGNSESIMVLSDGTASLFPTGQPM